jgi:tetratricopeptide (TPR) repeat protein
MRSLALCALILAAFATNAFAVGEARVTGKITDAATKEPIKDATITVEATEAKTFKQQFKVNPKDGTFAIFLQIEEAVAKKPELIAGYDALAKLYARQKEYPKAIDRANKALSFDPDQPEMYGVLYEAYNATGDKAKAAEAKKKMPANAAVLFNDAAKLLNASKDSEAEPILKQAIVADEKFAKAYYELGMIYVRAGKNAEAKTNLGKYLELEPNGKDAAMAKEMLKYVQ